MITKEFLFSDITIILLVLWVLPWKGIAMWKAAQRREKVWFMVFLIVNTLAILEIIYLFVIIKKNKKEDGNDLLKQNENEDSSGSERSIFQT